MEKTSCYSYFAIKGNFIPAEVTNLLGLQPTKSWAIGDPRTWGGVHDFACWEYGRTHMEYPGMEMQCYNVVKDLIGKEDALISLKDQSDVSFVLEIVPSIRAGKPPAIDFGADVIKFCHLTATDIDIDMYIYPYNE